ncbi:MAG: glycosyltransferase family 2 protein [Blastocatellia bacterium]
MDGPIIVAIELSIVIINWNGGTLLRRCIESIVQSPPSVSYEIILVDNSSTDDSLNWLRSDVAKTKPGGVKIRLIENLENVGFSKANNQAFTYSEAPMLLLLNNDTEVRPGAIDSLVATLESEGRIGACGPRLINPDGSLQVSAWRNPPTAWETLISGLRLYRLIPRSIRGELLLGRHWDHARRRRVGMLSAAALLIRRQVIDDVGGFDERFHMYAEDDEFCLRVVRARWWLVFEPDAVVMHRGGGGALTRWSSLERRLRVIDEGLRFQRYSLSLVHFISNLLANAFVLLLAAGWRRLRGDSMTETRMKFELYMKHLRQVLWDR